MNTFKNICDEAAAKIKAAPNSRAVVDIVDETVAVYKTLNKPERDAGGKNSIILVLDCASERINTFITKGVIS